jgi:hypothetical protein
MNNRVLTYLLVAMTSSFAGLTFAIEDDELGCIIGNCENGRGTLVSITDHGETHYAGNFTNGQHHGYGVLTYVDEGTVYKGNWVLGKKNGRGILWDRDKNVYMGQWRNDRRNGTGSQFFTVTDWVEDEHGEEWLKDNTENYTGGFKNDVFFGQGTYRWADGTRYVGAWVANKKHGEGYFDFGNNIRSYRKFEFDVKIFE